MKRLLFGTLIALTMVLTAPLASALENSWRLDVFDPVASTSTRTLNLEYKVISTLASDEFAVKLFQNGTQIASDSLTNDYGDSGVFKVNIAAVGTYTYSVVATNSGDASEQTQTRSVKIVEAPANTVRIVEVQGTSDSRQTQSTSPSAQATGSSTTKNVADAGKVDNAAVTDTATNTTQNQDNTKNDNNDLVWKIGLPAAILAAGAVIYWLRGRQLNA